MSIDKSLKIKGALTRHRNVLKRSERIEKLLEEERWEQGDSVIGLPKVANRKVRAAKKEKEVTTEVEGVEGAEGAEGAEAAATEETAAPAEDKSKA